MWKQLWSDKMTELKTHDICMRPHKASLSGRWAYATQDVIHSQMYIIDTKLLLISPFINFVL